MKICAAACVLLLTGCGGSKQTPAQETAIAQVDPATAATISGRVVFSGKAPVMPVLDMSANPACERLNKTPARAEQVVVNANGTLRNTFVWIASGLPAARWNPPATAVKLDQNGCVYQPHVLGIMVGQTLEIANSDTVNHNIHAEAAANPSWNITEPPRAENKFRVFDKQEVLFPLTCGVHPWMRAYVGVVAHPFFAVTGQDGIFTLRGVPPGNYTLEAVHEKYGKRQVQVTIAPRENKEFEFQYGPDASNK